jgi:flagellar basal body L-ring protein FlgH
MTLDQIRHHARFGSKPCSLLAAVLFAALGGCETVEMASTTTMVTAPTVAQTAVDRAPEPRGTKLRPVQFQVYSGAELQTLAADIKAGRRNDVVIIGLTPKGYQNLSTNLAELERYIREQKQVIAYLRKTGGSHFRPQPPRT